MKTNETTVEAEICLPWTISPDGQHIHGRETPEELPVIAKFYGAAVEDQPGAQALHYAVEAVNNHARLIEENARLREALEDMLALAGQLYGVADGASEVCETCSFARAALKS